ncbi:MAG: hypothetical protein HOP28_18050 [Gemmatimonadales bacterium]|nr:hypothetical protein [Gemmatimonadales bacterium]
MLADWEVDPQPILDISGTNQSGHPVFGDPIGATRLSNGMIVVADRSESVILLFDSSGTVIRSIGRKGSGPGEFEDMLWLRRCTLDSVFVMDRLLRLTVISPNGAIVRQGAFPIPLHDDRLACSKSGTFAAITNVRGGDQVDVKTWTFSQARGAVAVAQGGGPFRPVVDDIPVRVRRPLGQTTTLAVSSDHLFVGTKDSASVDRYTLGGQHVGRLPVDVALRKTTAREYDLAVEAQLAFHESSAVERREHKPLLARIPPPEFLPLYEELFVDALDSAWVVVSSLGDPATRLQPLFEGVSPRPVVTLPRAVRVFEIGADYILGRYEDDEGEAHVVLYRMKRPTGR